jgi:hypothetical protein
VGDEWNGINGIKDLLGLAGRYMGIFTFGPSGFGRSPDFFVEMAEDFVLAKGKKMLEKYGYVLYEYLHTMAKPDNSYLIFS